MSIIELSNKLTSELQDFMLNSTKSITPSTLNHHVLTIFHQQLPNCEFSIESYKALLEELQQSEECVQLPQKLQQQINEQLNGLVKILSQLQQALEIEKQYHQLESSKRRIELLNSVVSEQVKKQATLEQRQIQLRIAISEQVSELRGQLKDIFSKIPDDFRAASSSQELPPLPEPSQYDKWLVQINQLIEPLSIQVEGAQHWVEYLYHERQQTHLLEKLETQFNLHDINTVIEETQKPLTQARELLKHVNRLLADTQLYKVNKYYPDRLETITTDLAKLKHAQLSLFEKLKQQQTQDSVIEDLLNQLTPDTLGKSKSDDLAKQCQSIQALIEKYNPDTFSSTLHDGFLFIKSIGFDISAEQQARQQQREQSLTTITTLKLCHEFVSSYTKEKELAQEMHEIKVTLKTQKAIGHESKPLQSLIAQSNLLAQQITQLVKRSAPSSAVTSLDGLNRIPLQLKTMISNYIRQKEQLLIDLNSLTQTRSKLKKLSDGCTTATISSFIAPRRTRIEQELADELKIAVETISDQQLHDAIARKHEQLLQLTTQLNALKQRLQNSEQSITDVEQTIAEIEQLALKSSADQKELITLRTQVQHAPLTNESINRTILAIGSTISQLCYLKEPEPELAQVDSKQNDALIQLDDDSSYLSSDEDDKDDEHESEQRCFDSQTYLNYLKDSYQEQQSFENSVLTPYQSWYAGLYQQACIELNQLDEFTLEGERKAIQLANLFQDLKADLAAAHATEETDVIELYYSIGRTEDIPEPTAKQQVNILANFKAQFITSNIDNIELMDPKGNSEIIRFNRAITQLSSAARELSADSYERTLAINAYQIINVCGHSQYQDGDNAHPLPNLERDPHYAPLKEHTSVWGKITELLAKFFTAIANLGRDNPKSYRDSQLFFKPKVEENMGQAIDCLATVAAGA